MATRMASGGPRPRVGRSAGPKKWIQKATDTMAAKGTVGAFGKATPKKIAAAKKKGGLAEKRAVFAQNMKKIATEKKVGRAKKGKVPAAFVANEQRIKEGLKPKRGPGVGQSEAKESKILKEAEREKAMTPKRRAATERAEAKRMGPKAHARHEAAERKALRNEKPDADDKRRKRRTGVGQAAQATPPFQGPLAASRPPGAAPTGLRMPRFG